MKIRKKLLSILMTAALVLSLLPAVTLTASAAYDGEACINSGDVFINTPGNYRIYGDGTETAYKICLGWNTPGTINITLEDVNIKQSGDYSFIVYAGTSVNLTLVGTNIINATGGEYAGITLVESSTLVITKASTGTLNVTGGSYCAGIGGDRNAYMSQGTLVIEGGTVTAQGGKYAPGIGGALYATNFDGKEFSTSGAVVITGGTVNATGGQCAAGIGTAGVDGLEDVTGGGLVYISGGNVTATGGYLGGAGIGAGRCSTTAGMIVITGGTVIANGTYYGAGIGAGGGNYSCAGYINISGGNVTATGGGFLYWNGLIYDHRGGGAGIGGGLNGDASVVTISGGVVTAIGGMDSAPGIGGGNSDTSGNGDGGLVTITGGTVTSLRKDGTPDIGTGYTTVTSAREGSLYISGGSVNAGFDGTVYASNESNVPLYLTTVTGLPTSSAVTYSLDGGDSASCNTDENGYLYLWLPESAETTVDIRAGNAEYTVSGAVSSTDANSFAAAAVAHTASGAGAYSLTAVASTAYTTGAADGNLPTMTVNSDVSGFTYFEVSVYALTGHTGTETAVFVLTRGDQQIAINATTADFDTVGSAQAGFNVKPGDVIEVYLVDSLTNSSGTSPTIL
jgi:hypothetical protein